MQNRQLAQSEVFRAVAGRLERWRARHGGPGRRIPVELWQAAGAVALREGVPETAAALRLAEARLEWFASEAARGGEAGEGAEGAAGGAFVELEGARLFSAPIEVELRNHDGAVLRVKGSPDDVDVLALAGRLLGARQ